MQLTEMRLQGSTTKAIATKSDDLHFFFDPWNPHVRSKRTDSCKLSSDLCTGTLTHAHMHTLNTYETLKRFFNIDSCTQRDTR